MPTDIDCNQGQCVAEVDTNEYLPYLMDISESMYDYAKINLNEIPERRTQCMQELREKIHQETNLDSRTDDVFLLNFLRSRRFDVVRAMNMIKRYYSFLEAHRHIICRDIPTAALHFAESNIASFLPFRDNENRAILVIRAEAWDPSTFPADQTIYGGMIMMRTFLEIPANQIMGFVAIFDLKNLSIKQILSLLPRYAFFATQGLQYCCPCKVNTIHIVNVPEIFRLAWKLVKRVISEKLKKRIIFHTGQGYDSLHQQVPKAILPQELGGDQGPIKNDFWIKNIEKIQMEYDEEVSRGYMGLNKKSSKCNSSNNVPESKLEC